MTKEEIQIAFRHVAMGRVNTDAVVELAEKLEKLFAGPQPVAEPAPAKPARKKAE